MADETPAMVPSARELYVETTTDQEAIDVIEAAHRDGYLAGRAAERAALRKALTEMAVVIRALTPFDARVALRAVADTLLPTTPPAKE